MEEKTMLKQEISVYSERYDVHGVVRDYGVVTKLFFCYGGKEIVMGIDQNPIKGETFELIGKELIDSYISKLTVARKERKLQLHYWYIKELEDDGDRYRIACGIVTGHRKIADAMWMHTSAIREIHVDGDAGELVVTTQNNTYHCPLEYCQFRKQDAYPDIIPDYERLKETYKGKIEYPSIEPGRILLVLANFSDYYFHSIYYVPESSADGEPLDYTGWPHVGTSQDSYLIMVEEAGIDLRYFPHFQNIEFYSMDTGEIPLFLENIGDVTIYAKTCCGTIRLDPGDRKEVSEENAEEETPRLPDGDLYPAGIIE